MHKPTALVFLLFSWLPTIQAAPATPVTLAVLELEAKGVAQNEAAVLTDKLRSVLISSESFRVIDREKMDEILKEQGFQQSGTCTESSCFIEVGQLLGVKNLVTGSVGKVGRTYSITVNLISVRTGEIEKVVSHSYAGSIDNLLTREMEVVGQRLAGVKVNSVNKRKISARKAFPIAIGIAGLMTGTGAALSFLEKNHTEKDYHKADNQVDIDRLAKDINSARTRGIVFSSATALLIPTAVATYLLGNSNEENNENPRDNQRLEISLFPVFNEYASGFSLKIQF